MVEATCFPTTKLYPFLIHVVHILLWDIELLYHLLIHVIKAANGSRISIIGTTLLQTSGPSHFETGYQPKN